MKAIKITMIVCITLYCSLASLSAARANDVGSIIKYNWDRQERGISGILDCWTKGSKAAAYKNFYRDIISGEINLIAFGTSPVDERMVSRLLDSTMGFNPANDAYHLFLHKFKQKANWTPSQNHLYKNRSFSLYKMSNIEHKFIIKP